jgi:putative membrane protein
MMYGYGPGWGWMMLMPLLWIVLLGVIIWAVVRLVPRPGDRAYGDRGYSSGPPRETAQEILDRRYASGEIDADTYTRMRTHLSGRDAKSP